jgi:putative transposase
MITDKLGSYGAATQDVMPDVEHRQHRRLNNRAEKSHQPTRHRERTMRRFTSAGHAHRFLAAFGLIREHFVRNGIDYVRWSTAANVRTDSEFGTK